MKNIFRVVIIALFSSVTLFSCTPRVGVTGTWKSSEESIGKKYNSVFLATMMSDELVSRSVQDQLALQLSEKSLNSTKSYYVFPDMYRKEVEINKEKIFEKVNEAKNDCILTVSAFDVETEKRYVPNTSTVYTPYLGTANLGNFWGFYTYYRPRVYRDGYMSEERVYFVEVDLFDAKTEKLIWSIQTKTYNPRDLNEFSEEFAQTVIKQLKDDDII